MDAPSSEALSVPFGATRVAATAATPKPGAVRTPSARSSIRVTFEAKWIVGYTEHSRGKRRWVRTRAQNLAL